jgi:Asp-tRNA(Asn)/Glu-tRNA(Gln) amidotransferase A subunit family amidase
MPHIHVPERRLTIVEAAAALACGELTCEGLLETCLERIDACEDQIHAWVSVDREGARQQARDCDARLAARHRAERSAEPLFPLLGIPIGIKDIIDVAGQVTGAGSEARKADPPAERDATVVRKLREAGAIILGKTVTTQFASFDPAPTRNPWNLKRTPGGSSSGSAAAVAAGMCLGAIGSQTGGSIIRPASFCGVAGCKPTFGRVSLDGFVPVAPSLDTAGPIAGCVADLAIILNAISVGDEVIRGGDPTLKLWGDVAQLNPQKQLNPRKNAPPRLGLLGGFFGSADSDMRTALDRAVSKFRAAGASIDVRDPQMTWLDSQRTIVAYDMAAWHRERFRKLRFDYLPVSAGFIEEGLLITDARYQAARREQARAIAAADALLEGVDALVCPAARGAAPDPSTTGDPSFQSLWTYTGQPSITFAMGLSDNGLPLGIQLIGRRFDEVGLFPVAAWCEAVLPGLMAQEKPKEPAG